MVRYCNVYQIEQLRQFYRWTTIAQEGDQEFPPDTICYVWDDFTVGKSLVPNDVPIVSAVIPEWQEFCKRTLRFDPPVAQTKSSDTPIINQSTSAGELPLTPPTKWFFSLHLSNPHHYNMPMIFPIPPAMDVTLLEQGIQHIINHYDVLRMRFTQDKMGTYQSHILSEDAASILSIGLSMIPEQERASVIEVAATQLQASLNLLRGPLIRIVHFEVDMKKPGYLLFIFHHMIMDPYSLQLIAQQFITVYEQLSSGNEVRLLPEKTTFKEYAQHLSKYGQSEALKRDIHYWLALPWERVVPLPVDYPEGTEANYIASVDVVSTSLGVEATEVLLRTFPRLYKTGILDVLLTALVQTFARWTKVWILHVGMVFSGRNTYSIFEDIDLSCTVGNFAQGGDHCILDLEGITAFEEQLHSVQDQIRRVPHQGLSALWLEYLCQDPAISRKMQELPRQEIVFDYLGQSTRSLPSSLQSALPLSSIGPSEHLQNMRRVLLLCGARISNGCLEVNWEYSKNVHHHTTIEHLAKSYIETLQTIITYASRQV